MLAVMPTNKPLIILHYLVVLDSRLLPLPVRLMRSLTTHRTNRIKPGGRLVILLVVLLITIQVIILVRLVMRIYSLSPMTIIPFLHIVTVILLGEVTYAY